MAGWVVQAGKVVEMVAVAMVVETAAATVGATAEEAKAEAATVAVTPEAVTVAVEREVVARVAARVVAKAVVVSVVAAKAMARAVVRVMGRHNAGACDRRPERLLQPPHAPPHPSPMDHTVRSGPPYHSDVLLLQGERVVTAHDPYRCAAQRPL